MFFANLFKIRYKFHKIFVKVRYNIYFQDQKIKIHMQTNSSTIKAQWTTFHHPHEIPEYYINLEANNGTIIHSHYVGRLERMFLFTGLKLLQLEVTQLK